MQREIVVSADEWQGHQDWEAGWWGDCTNTYGEETKQLTYAHRMGLKIAPWGGHWPVYDLGGKSVVDLGGGPASMLLKTINGAERMVVDPIFKSCPQWVFARYYQVGIKTRSLPAEEFVPETDYDECWIYNVLQHVMDPETIIKNARAFSKRIRIFEWIDLPPHQGHPHELKEEKLNDWLGGKGTVESVSENGCFGRAYFGMF